MSTALKPERITKTSPCTKARVAGIFYLITDATGFFAEGFVRGKLIIHGDAAATSANILAHQLLFRMGFAADIIAGACYIAVTVLLYELLKPISRTISLLAAAFSITGCAIGALNALFHLAPLAILIAEPRLGAFSAQQLQSLASISLTIHGQGTLVGLTFFGLYCLLIGCLILKSTFLPRILGALMALAGLCYLVNSFANFLSPSFASHLFPWIIAPCGIGEISLTLWLLVKGVNPQRWIDQAIAKGERV
jgi:hypothetical protein